MQYKLISMFKQSHKQKKGQQFRSDKVTEKENRNVKRFPGQRVPVKRKVKMLIINFLVDNDFRTIKMISAKS